MNLPFWSLATITILSSACSNQTEQQSAQNRAKEVQMASSHATGEPRSESNTFTVGSSADQVMSAMGRPDYVRAKSGGEIEIWSYKFSTVAFRGGRVTEWEDHSSVLKTSGSGDTRLAESEPKIQSGQSDLVAVSPEIAAKMGARVPSPPPGATPPSVQYVESYQRGDGSTVQGHFRTVRDSSKTNNLSSRGNVTPYTRKRGSR